MVRRSLQIILPILVIAMGLLGAKWLISLKQPPVRQARPHLGPLVEVMSVESSEASIEVSGHGEVSPKTVVSVAPQVGGVVVETHPSLVAGGFIEAGQPLVRIDPRDYELAVARAEAAVARAQTTVDRETAEADVARGEWYALHPGSDPPSGLVLREPQIRQAQAELTAARADLATAQLALDRTRVTAPFDAVVAEKHIDLGQFVPAGQTICRLYGTDAVEVVVPLPDRELAWFDVPRHTRRAGPDVELRAHFAGAEHHWRGVVTRMEADVDPQSRMVRVVVEVAEPFAVTSDRPPLLPGVFVEVAITGRTLPNVLRIPRHALRDGDQLWVAVDGRLEIRDAEVVRRDRSYVYLAQGLRPGEELVLTPLNIVTHGMKIRAQPATSPEAGDLVAGTDPEGPAP